MTSDRNQPTSYDTSAEKALLGSLLINGKSIEQIFGFIQPSYFYSERERLLYQCCAELHKQERVINQITLANELNRRNKLKDCGGAAYLSYLISICPTSLDIEYYAQIVAEYYQRRLLLGLARSLTKRVSDGVKPDEIASWALQEFSKFETLWDDIELTQIDDYLVDTGKTNTSLWSEFLFQQAIHLFSGEAGVGKTTFLYNLSTALVKGQEFLGFRPPRPLRVVYYDLESPKSLIKTRLSFLGEGSFPNLFAGRTENFVNDMPKIILLVKSHNIDVVIVDPISMAFRTEKEEDNAEANWQMRAMRLFTRQTGVALILVHHLGKTTPGKIVHKARGASARPAAADVVINFEGISDDTVRLEMAKNRIVGGITTLFLNKVDGRFGITEVSGEISSTERYKAQEAITSLLATGEKHWQELLNISDFSRATLQRALTSLQQLGKVIKTKRGVYHLNVS